VDKEIPTPFQVGISVGMDGCNQTCLEKVVLKIPHFITINATKRDSPSRGQIFTMFEKLSKKMGDSTTPISNKKKHQATDASSPAKQSEAKRQDSKLTPPTKNHPVTMQL
jgi:hypothetical protein